MIIEITELSINKENTIYYSPEKCSYTPIIKFTDEQVKKAFDFAYDMTFGEKGKHRTNRSGGTSHRKNGEIFANAFQGKLAEFGFKQFYENKYSDTLSEINLSCSELGTWDSCDFNSKWGPIAVKSTKYYSGLLLLETKDWNDEGLYIPNKNLKYIIIALVRIGIDIDRILKKSKLLYSTDCDKSTLESLFPKSLDWTCDIPGYIRHEDLVYVIKNKIIIKKGDFLNKTEMDATNYYIKAKDLRKWSE